MLHTHKLPQHRYQSNQQYSLLEERKEVELLIPVPKEETKTVYLKQHWKKINREHNLSCGEAAEGD